MGMPDMTIGEREEWSEEERRGILILILVMMMNGSSDIDVAWR